MRLLVWCVLGLVVWSARAATYHVDSQAGDDAGDGTSAAAAWRSFAPVNAHHFAPGDRILLHAGSAWSGTQLHPLGSGAPGHPIVIDREGEGPAPVLRGEGQVAAVLLLENQQYWEINHLDISNRGAARPGHWRGVEIRAKDLGLVHHLHLSNLAVHDVNAVSNYTDDGDTVAKSFGGIGTVIEGSALPTAWDGLLLENCTIRDCGPMGFVMLSSWLAGHRENDPKRWLASRGVIIRGNTFERIARNGLLVRGAQAPLIEHNLFRECGLFGSGNAMFVFHCDDALIQFNESCFTKYNPGDADAAGFDSDYNCRRSVFQYNYSHDNDYGFILICSLGGKAKGFNDGTVIRYNISQNDGGNLIRFSGTVTNALIYNNTFYTGPAMANPKDPNSPPRLIYYKSWQGWSKNVRFQNNIFYNDSPTAVYDFGESTGNVFNHNLFFGHHPASEPADPAKITGDPHFVGRVGQAGAGVPAARQTYALGEGSAARGAGEAIPGQSIHPDLGAE